MTITISYVIDERSKATSGPYHRARITGVNILHFSSTILRPPGEKGCPNQFYRIAYIVVR
jgi:hypothetical protein